MEAIEISEIFKVAVEHHGAGRLDRAEELYHQVLRSVPNHPAALHSLAVIASQRGRYDTAIELAGKAIKEMPEIPQFYNTIGAAFKASGKLQEAADACGQAISLKGDYAEAYKNLAEILQAQGRIDEAIENYKEVIRLRPNVAGLYYNLGIILNEQGHVAEAIANYKQAIRLKPDFAEAYFNLGNILKDQSDDTEAIENYKKAMEFKPTLVMAYNNLASILRGQGRIDEAIENYKQVVRLKPDFVNVYNILGYELNEQKRYGEAIEYYKQAIQIDPDCSGTYNNMAVIRMAQGHYDEAEEICRQALQFNSDSVETHFNMGLILLLTDRYIDGWKEYEWRLDPRHNTCQDSFSQPRWDGSSFVGKRLLVNWEQGFGDSLQFIRYLPMVKERGGTVIFRDRKSLAALLRQFPGIDELAEVAPNTKSSINFDYHVSLLSLPGIFATTVETIPADVPYLYADPVKVEYWRKRLCGAEFKVGIVWAGSGVFGAGAYGSKKEYNRSCGLEYFAGLAGIDGVRLYGLQKGKQAAEVENLPDGMAVTNLGEEFEDFADTAAAIENLDLIISVDTAVAHLAGAMGKRVWTLLPFVPDWRWRLDCQDSIWYPTMKLFRQGEPGAWREVFARVEEELQLSVTN